jgi:GMP synthase (glutamine-hydrolysing)
METKKIIIIKTGEAFPHIVKEFGDFEDWISKGLGQKEDDIQVVNVEHQHPLPDIGAVKGVVIAGSHAMVTQDLDWSLAMEAWVPKLIQAQIPLLGICYGHQLIARAMGGVVDFHPKGIEIGTTDIDCLDSGDKDPLFRDLPKQFKAHVCHFQSVIKLPDSAVILTKNRFEPHHAFRIGKSAWGVQFHPEYDISIMKAELNHMGQTIHTSGHTPGHTSDQDLDLLLARVEDTPVAGMILKRFGVLASL